MAETTRSGYSMSAREWTLLVLLSVLWGGSFFFNQIALGQVGPVTVVAARVSIGALVLWAIIIATRRAVPIRLRHAGDFIVLALLNNVIPFNLILWGQTRIAGGLAAILNATTPLFTVVIAHLLTRDERLSVQKTIGVLIGIGGVAVLIGRSALAGSGNLAAELAVIGAALSYGFAGVFGRRFKELPPLATAAGQLTASSIVALPMMLMFDPPWRLPQLHGSTIGALLAIAIVSTGLAYIVYFRILAAAGATNILLVTLLVPVTANILGIAVLSDHLTTRAIFGMGLIALGLLAIDGRALRAATRRNSAGRAKSDRRES
jgi:drug/metabolite transporter (DMT)-like permease